MTKYIPISEAAERLGISEDEAISQLINGDLLGKRDASGWAIDASSLPTSSKGDAPKAGRGYTIGCFAILIVTALLLGYLYENTRGANHAGVVRQTSSVRYCVDGSGIVDITYFETDERPKFTSESVTNEWCKTVYNLSSGDRVLVLAENRSQSNSLTCTIYADNIAIATDTERGTSAKPRCEGVVR